MEKKQKGKGFIIGSCNSKDIFISWHYLWEKEVKTCQKQH